MLVGIMIALLQDSPDLVAGRFTSFVERAKGFEVDVEVKVGAQKLAGAGKVRIARPNMVYFAMKLGRSDYSYGANEDEVIEVERGRGLYYEHYPLDKVYAPLGKVSSTPDLAFPAVFLGGLRQMLPPNSTFKLSGKDIVQGVETDHLVGGDGMMHAYIARDGRLLRLNLDIVTDTGDRIILDTDFKNYVIDKSFAKNDFSVEIPIGYIPASLPKDPYTWSEDEPFPTKWTEVGGISVDMKALSGGQNFLAIATVPDCAPSVKAIAQVRAVESQLKLPIYVISLDSKGAVPREYNGYRRFYDPAGKAWITLLAPGTPLFYLVNGKGTVIRTWYGFDEEKPSLLKDVKAALAKPATTE